MAPPESKKAQAGEGNSSATAPSKKSYVKNKKKKKPTRPIHHPEEYARSVSKPTSAQRQAQTQTVKALPQGVQIRSAQLVYITVSYEDPLTNETQPIILHDLSRFSRQSARLEVYKAERMLSLAWVMEKGGDEDTCERINIPDDGYEFSFGVYGSCSKMSLTAFPIRNEKPYVEMVWHSDHGHAHWRESLAVENLILKYLKDSTEDEISYTDIARKKSTDPNSSSTGTLNSSTCTDAAVTAGDDDEDGDLTEVSGDLDRNNGQALSGLNVGSSGFLLPREDQYNLDVQPTAGTSKQPWVGTGNWQSEDFLKIYSEVTKGEVVETEDAEAKGSSKGKGKE